MALNPRWKAVRDITAVLRREAAASNAQVVEGIADRVDAAVRTAVPSAVSVKVDEAIAALPVNDPVRPPGVPTDAVVLLKVIAALKANGGAVAKALTEDSQIAAWVDHMTPDIVDPA